MTIEKVATTNLYIGPNCMLIHKRNLKQRYRPSYYQRKIVRTMKYLDKTLVVNFKMISNEEFPPIKHCYYAYYDNLMFHFPNMLLVFILKKGATRAIIPFRSLSSFHPFHYAYLR